MLYFCHFILDCVKYIGVDLIVYICSTVFVFCSRQQKPTHFNTGDCIKQHNAVISVKKFFDDLLISPTIK